MTETIHYDFDLAVVGGGPAGQAAAEQAVRAGLRVAIIDEQPRMGGQILRQPPTAFRVANWLPGRVYRGVKAQLARAQALAEITWLGRTSVIGLLRPDFGEPGFVLRLSAPEGGQAISARRVLVAGGCYDMPVPLPGWTLPGVMSAGGVQAFIKSQQLVAGERFLLAGTHPLQLLVADQILSAGGQVAAILFAQPLSAALGRLLRAPGTALRHAGKLALAAASVVRLKRAGVPLLFGRTVARVLGTDHVDAAVVARIGPRELRAEAEPIACDRVALCFGFLPQSDLPRMAGAAMHWAAPAGGWAADHDAWMRSSEPDLYVAGETTGVGGAEIALREGRLAGLGVAIDAGRLAPAAAAAMAAGTRRELDSLRRFAAMLDSVASPRDYLALLPEEDTLICRCEDVSLGAIAAARAAGASHANAVKLVTRAGMGLCQGRSCEHMLLRLMAGQGACPRSSDGFTPRFPVRPTPIATLID